MPGQYQQLEFDDQLSQDAESSPKDATKVVLSLKGKWTLDTIAEALGEIQECVVSVQYVSDDRYPAYFD